MARIRCIDGRLWRHDPQPDDPYLETDIGTCPECEGDGCEELAEESPVHPIFAPILKAMGGQQ